jgi:transcriptional regulator with XRE-family HTH domain
MNKHPIWRILKEQGRSQKWLAKRIGRSHSHVRHCSIGQRNPGQEFRQRCADVLGIPVDMLFVGREMA